MWSVLAISMLAGWLKCQSSLLKVLMRFHSVVLKSLFADADFMWSNKYGRPPIVNFSAAENHIIKFLWVITKIVWMQIFENEWKWSKNLSINGSVIYMLFCAILTWCDFWKQWGKKRLFTGSCNVSPRVAFFFSSGLLLLRGTVQARLILLGTFQRSKEPFHF